MTPPDDNGEERGRGAARRRLTATAGGLAVTVVLALLGLAALGGLLAGLALLVLAMPMTTLAVLTVFAVGGFAAWRARQRRR